MRGRETARGAVLVGFMGAGKSSVGRELARRLKTEFIDVDDRIEAAAGRTIGEIFRRDGEQAFREKEREAILDAVSVPGRVIATGGGAFLDATNRRLLKTYAPVIFLEVSPATALERLAEDTSRPLLQGEDREKAVTDLMKKRLPAYREADFRVSTESVPAEQVAEKVFLLLAREATAGPSGKRSGRNGRNV